MLHGGCPRQRGPRTSYASVHRRVFFNAWALPNRPYPGGGIDGTSVDLRARGEKPHLACL